MLAALTYEGVIKFLDKMTGRPVTKDQPITPNFTTEIW